MEGEIASLDGRRFSLEAGIDGLDLRLGGYVMLEGDGGTKLGQVRSLEVAETDLGEMGLPGDDNAEVRTGLRIGLARGDGVILDRGIRVHSADVGGDGRLRLRFGELAPATQAALLQLDPVADREEYAELRALLVEARPESLEELATADAPSSDVSGSGSPTWASSAWVSGRAPTPPPCSRRSTTRRCAASSSTPGRWRPALSRHWSRRACSAACGSAAASGVRSSWSSTRPTTCAPRRRPTC